MKYTILGFQQQKLMDLGLKSDDALILRTIKDMYSSAGMEFITKDNERYMWLNQKYFIQQIPIIGSRSTLLRKIENMAELGLLVKLLKHSRKGQRGNFSYIKPTMLLDSLQDYDPYVNLKQGLCQNDTSLMSNRHNKDTSIKDTSIKDTTGLMKLDKDLIIKTWNDLNMQQLRNINSNTKRCDSLKARIKEYSFDEVIQVIKSVKESNFLQGNNDRGWQATFDWVLLPNNFVKVLEGNYTDKKTTSTRGNIPTAANTLGEREEDILCKMLKNSN